MTPLINYELGQRLVQGATANWLHWPRGCLRYSTSGEDSSSSESLVRATKAFIMDFQAELNKQKDYGPLITCNYRFLTGKICPLKGSLCSFNVNNMQTLHI